MALNSLLCMWERGHTDLWNWFQSHWWWRACGAEWKLQHRGLKGKPKMRTECLPGCSAWYIFHCLSLALNQTCKALSGWVPSYLQASQKYVCSNTEAWVFFMLTEAGESFWGWRFSLLFPKMIINYRNASFMFSCIPDLIKVPNLPRSVVLAIVYQEAGRTKRKIIRLCQFNLVRSDSVRSSHLISFFEAMSGEGNFPTYDLSTNLKLLLEHPRSLHIYWVWWLSGKFIEGLDRRQAGWPQNCWSSVRSQDSQFCQWDLQGPDKKMLRTIFWSDSSYASKDFSIPDWISQ